MCYLAFGRRIVVTAAEMVTEEHSIVECVSLAQRSAACISNRTYAGESYSNILFSNVTFTNARVTHRNIALYRSDKSVAESNVIPVAHKFNSANRINIGIDIHIFKCCIAAESKEVVAFKIETCSVGA